MRSHPDNDHLRYFIDGSILLLGWGVNNRDPLVPKLFRDPLLVAWQSLRRTVAEVKRQLSRGGQSLRGRLRNAGLLGDQLVLKLHGFWEALGTLIKSQTLESLKAVLKWVDLLLGSIAKAIAPAEAVAEFKEAFELLLDGDPSMALPAALPADMNLLRKAALRKLGGAL